MSQVSEYVKLLMFRFRNHEYQTDGFSWDYTTASNEEVRATTDVFEDTINGLSTVILEIVKPEYRKKIRKQIAYLIGLRHRQQEVWAAYIADCDARINKANQWVQLHTQ